jgi:hypothetical protein
MVCQTEVEDVSEEASSVRGICGLLLGIDGKGL